MKDIQQINSIKPSKIPFKIAKGLIIKIGVVVIIIGIPVLTGVTLATRIWDPLWNPFRPESEEVIQRMYQNMKDTNSYHMEAVLITEESSKKTIVKMTGDFDKRGSNDTEIKGKLEFTSESDLSFTSLGLNYMIANKKIFVSIGEIPSLMGVDFSAISGQWIDFGEFYNFQKDLESFRGFIEKTKQMLTLKEALKDEEINNKKVYHYLLEINEEELKELLSQTIADPISLIAGMVGGSEYLEKELENIKDFEINYFIGKEDELLYKISFYQEDELESGKESLSFELTFSDFNKELYITKPIGSKSIEEILSGFFEGAIEVLPALSVPLPK